MREVGHYDFAQEILLVVVDSKLFYAFPHIKATLSQFLFIYTSLRCEEQLADSATAHFEPIILVAPPVSKFAFLPEDLLM